MLTPTEASESPRTPVWRAAVQMLYEPRQGGPAASRAGIWFPLLLLAASAAVVNYPLLFRIGLVALVDLKLHTTPEGLGRLAMLAFTVMYLAAPVSIVVVAWLAGELMNWYLYLALDARAQRRAVLRTTAYGMLPVAVGNGLAAAINLLPGRDSSTFNPLASNLGFFFNPTETGAFWYEFASGLDVFSVWALAAIALGLAGLGQRRAAALLPPLVALWLMALVARAWLLS